ncbi:uncharacterized protein LOC121381157 [Gigantopelta aegis]|uniref:uncharacterized protein LOC121381157 n=1 Tax=Gigantopelta aegis TaxID=1735272 RepID=UPI001B88D125|nr:uncharacterized protein LOC121381157 [Gigantopelta aegis]
MKYICYIVFVFGLCAALVNPQMNAQNQQGQDHMMQAARMEDYNEAHFKQRLNSEVERLSGQSTEQVFHRYRTSEHAIAEQYSGLFETSEETEVSQAVWDSKHQHQNHDCDRCCPTRVYHRRTILLRNTRGQNKVLVHLSNIGKFQFLRHAECVPGAGSCNGHCVMEMMSVYLMVWNLNSETGLPFSIDRFEVPGYCSCKRWLP